MIKSFKHKGLQAFFEKGSKAGIQAAHAEKLSRLLSRLNESTQAQDMNVPGWRLHRLSGLELGEHYSVWVNANWRIIFAFDGMNAVLVDYLDYH